MEQEIKELIGDLLEKLDISFSKIEVKKDTSQSNYRINIDSDEPSILIGYHGETILALQHLGKVLLWKTSKEESNILLDVDNYRQRQEENVINLAERKMEEVRETGNTQSLPPMSPYFRRIVHLHVAQTDDLETESSGTGDRRSVIIRTKA